MRTAAAGHDLLLVCHTAPAQRAAYEAVVAAYRDKTLPIRRARASMARLDALDARRPERVTGGAPRAEPDGEPLARAMAARAVMVVAAPDAGLAARAQRARGRDLPARSPRWPRASPSSPRCRTSARYLREAMAPHGVRPEATVVGVEPTAEEIEQARAAAAAADATVLFLYDAHLYKSNQRAAGGLPGGRASGWRWC